MASELQGSDLDPANLHHHTTDGRNIIPAGQGVGGQDIFFAAVQMSRMPMLLTDPAGADNPIIFCNQAFERLTGYAQSEIIGRNCRFLQGADTDREALARIRSGIARYEDVHEDILNYRKDGSAFWNALFVSPVFAPDGSIIYFFASQLDVTRRHEAEAAIQQAQRLETLGSLASGVAHEFNNLLTVILGSLSQIERGMPEGSRDRQRLDRAKWASEQAGRLTQQMLSFARRQFHEVQVVDLNEVIADFDGILGQLVGPTVKLRLDLSQVPVRVGLDAGQLEMALLNVARNAADAMPDGGNLLIRTSHSTADGEGGQRSGLVEVIDNGTGMSPDVVKRAAEPFYTTKPKGSGTGLGLSMVNGFAEQSGGHMKLTSAPGTGTTVSLSFPIAD